LRYRTVNAMERKKKAKHPCEGCVWRTHTSEDKVLCLFPKCMREEYKRLWPRTKATDHEETKAD